MGTALVLVIIIIGILIATGTFGMVWQSIVGGLVKLATIVIVIVVIGAYAYNKLFG